MPKSFQRKAFNQWMSRNQGLFRHPPVSIENRKKHFNMRFRNINSVITCTITSYDYSISVNHEGECWDLLDTGDLSEQRALSGQYFCGACISEHQKLFPTRAALWEDHIFKQILNWANNNLLKTKWVCLFQYGEGATEARIVDENNLLTVMQNKNFVKAIPLMKNQVMPNQKFDTRENISSDH